MMRLIQNENMKIYRRKRTWVMLGILVLALILVAVVMVTHQHHASGNWKQSLATQTANLQKTLQQSSHMPAATVSKIQAQIQLNQYEIAHNINPNLRTAWKFATDAFNLSTLLIAFILVIAGDIVASEFSTGTVKMLLTQTATRTRVLVAKFIAMLLFSIFATTLMFVASYIVGGGFSISMLIAYFIVMMVLTWFIFAKRDIAYT